MSERQSLESLNDVLHIAGEDTWRGGDYELAVELGERNDARLQSAYEAVFAYKDWIGPLNRQGNSIIPDWSCWHSDPYFWPGFTGVAVLADGRKLPASVGCVREGQDTPEEKQGTDWLKVGFPMGGINAVYPTAGGYPFAPADRAKSPSKEWQITIEDYLAQLGIWIYSHVAYRLAVVAFEDMGQTRLASVVQNGGVPQDRWRGYLLPSGDQVRYYPSTVHEPLFTVG